MPDISRLTVEVAPKGIADTKAQLDALTNSSKATEKTTTSLMDKFARMRDVMQGPVAAFGTLVRGMKQIYAAGKELVDIYAIQERAVSNLNAVLKATGGTVGMTSEELQSMASAFQEVTLFGDEAIIGMNAVLLGFRGIKGDQFERTTEAILDMSTIMGTDLVSSANLLGKALDGPTQGMSALSRVGFVFTAEQKEMVKVLEESGDLLGAQEIILGEVEKAFGGAARAAGDTATGAFVKLGNAIGDLKENFGQMIAEGLQPFINKLTEAITKETEMMKAIGARQKEAASIAQVAGVVSSGKGAGLADATKGMSIEDMRLAYSLAVQSNPLATNAQAGAIRMLGQIIEGAVRAKAAADDLAASLGVSGAGGPAGGSASGQYADDVLAKMREQIKAAELKASLLGTEVTAEERLNIILDARIKLLDENSKSIKYTEDQISLLVDQITLEEKDAIAKKATAEATKNLADEVDALNKKYADPKETLFAQMERIKELFESGVIGATTMRSAMADLQSQLDELDIRPLTEYERAIIAIEVAMQNALKQGYIDSFMAIGEALASGGDAGESFVRAMADMGLQMLNQLPMLLLNAGLQAIIANPLSPLGYALVAASGIVAIGAGAANYASSGSVSANALGNVYNSKSLSAYSGGVYDKPQMFAFARGAGVFGEAGPEAIMPLSRGTDGKLGVKASGSTVSVVINNNASGAVASASETTGADGSKQIVVMVENIMRGAFAAGKMDSSMTRYNSRPRGIRG